MKMCSWVGSICPEMGRIKAPTALRSGVLDMIRFVFRDAERFRGETHMTVAKNVARRTCSAMAVALALSLVAPWLQAQTSNKPNRQSDVVKTSAGELRLTPLYHGSVMLEF